MDCPVCKNVSLVMSERQGIEIDYCPNCRGVWLDRGELDKIIERSLAGTPAPAHAPAPAATQFGSQPQRAPDPRYQQPDPRYQQHGGYSHGHGAYPHHKKKKEGFLSDLFDFD
ncbi:zf-TFIIB domain-containing protein [Pseudoduganella sp.]|uniref:TFIIB-type zinc ribbon-containing protein n=1 Tax=Pseudoduganella sp. TaxID=1880898 RepID=UPI0035B41F8F